MLLWLASYVRFQEKTDLFFFLVQAQRLTQKSFYLMTKKKQFLYCHICLMCIVHCLAFRLVWKYRYHIWRPYRNCSFINSSVIITPHRSNRVCVFLFISYNFFSFYFLIMHHKFIRTTPTTKYKSNIYDHICADWRNRKWMPI